MMLRIVRESVRMGEHNRYFHRHCLRNTRVKDEVEEICVEQMHGMIGVAPLCYQRIPCSHPRLKADLRHLDRSRISDP